MLKFIYILYYEVRYKSRLTVIIEWKMKNCTDTAILILRKAVDTKHEADASDMKGRFTSAEKMQDLADKYTAGAPSISTLKGNFKVCTVW